MKAILSILFAAGLRAPALFAAETLPVAEASPTSEVDGKSAPAPYELKKRSSFEVAAGLRPPFWPIGWVKRERNVLPSGAIAPKFVLDARSFTVTSILLGPPAIAVINGRAYEEGQIIRMARLAVPIAAPAGGMPAGGPRIRVQRIADGQVWLQGEGQTVSVSLKRPELSERKIQEERLNSEVDEDLPLPAVSAR